MKFYYDLNYNVKLDKLPRRMIYIKDKDILFKSPISFMYDPMYLTKVLNGGLSRIEIKEDYRIDLAVPDFSKTDVTYYHYIHLINNKTFGIFSYTKFEKVFVPNVNEIDNIITSGITEHQYDKLLVYDNIESDSSSDNDVINDMNKVDKGLDKVDSFFESLNSIEYLNISMISKLITILSENVSVEDTELESIKQQLQQKYGINIF